MVDSNSPTRERPSIAARILRGLGISSCVVLAMIALFEIGARVFALPGLTRDKLDPTIGLMKDARVGPHPYLAYANRPNFAHEPSAKDPTSVHHNSLGFRGRETTWAKPAGTYRILCLGGSSTYGIGPSSDETNWPTRLEFHLNQAGLAKKIEVINGGAQGYSTFEMAINLAVRGVDLAPDLVLCYEAINDMRCALYHGVTHDNTHWRAVWPVARDSTYEAVLEKSYLFLAWRRYATDWWKRKQDLGSYVIVDFGKYGNDDYAQATDPDLGFTNFTRNIVSIIGIAHAHGAEVMLVTQGIRIDDLDRFGSREAQKAGFMRIIEIVGQLANDRSVPFCDARSVLVAEADRQRAADGKDRIFVRPEERNGEVHMTDAGCELLAKTLAARVVELQLVK